MLDFQCEDTWFGLGPSGIGYNITITLFWKMITCYFNIFGLAFRPAILTFFVLYFQPDLFIKNVKFLEVSRMQKHCGIFYLFILYSGGILLCPPCSAL